MVTYSVLHCYSVVFVLLVALQLAGGDGGGPLPVLEDADDFAALRDGDRVRVSTRAQEGGANHLGTFGDHCLRIPKRHITGQSVPCSLLIHI